MPFVLPDQNLDINLMTLVAAGDRSAQGVAVRRLEGRAQRLSRSLLRHGADANDASQASLVEILRCAGEYRGDSSLERWADRIVLRTALRFAKRERRAHGSEMPEAPDAGVPAAGEDSAIVQQVLAALPEAQRTAIILRHVFEYSVEEIAEITQVSPNTVKDRLLRGREYVRNIVRRDDKRGATEVAGRA